MTADTVSQKLRNNNVFTVAKRNVEGQDMLYQSVKLTNGIWILAELKIQPGNPNFTVWHLEFFNFNVILRFRFYRSWFILQMLNAVVYQVFYMSHISVMLTVWCLYSNVGYYCIRVVLFSWLCVYANLHKIQRVQNTLAKIVPVSYTHLTLPTKRIV